MDNKELALKALNNRTKAHAPYSKYKVGAALMTEEGEVFDGANVENASYGLTICAERVAAVSAVAAGKKKFKKIAVACGDEDYCRPCGACRQFLAEFSPDMEIIMVNAKGDTKSVSLNELLPYNFSLEGGSESV